MSETRKTVLSNIMLIIAASIWGSNFVFQKIVATEIGPYTFMACRCLLGSATIFIILLFMTLREKKSAEPQEGALTYDKPYFIHLLKVAFFCGIINVTGSVLVQYGLIYTTASKAGFLNTIYIIFVPIVGMLFFRKKSGKYIWLGVVLAVIGLYNLCAKETVLPEKGDAVILLSTLFFAFHIQLISKYVNVFNGIHLACAEFFGAFIFCSVIAFTAEHPTLTQITNCAPSILFAGVLGIGVCYALQVTAQKHTDPTVASLLMSLESVFGALGGILILGEAFTRKEFIGILFICASIVIAQLPDKPKKVN